MAARRLIGAALVGALAALTLIAGGPAAVAAPGDLDPSFGGGDGIATLATNFSGSGYEVAVQPDGKVVVLNRLAPAAGFDSLTRFNANGTLDTDFGDQGTATVSRGFGESNDVALLGDGSIVVVGYNQGGRLLGQVLKFTAAGDPDLSFGENGNGSVFVSNTSLEGSSELTAAYEQAGKLVVVGSKYELIGADFRGGVLAMRLLPNGMPDPLFGTGGQVWANDRSLGTVESYTAPAIALQPDGSALVAAQLSGGFAAIVYVYRLGSDGALSVTNGGTEVANILGGAVTAAAPVPGGGMVVAFNGVELPSQSPLRVLQAVTAAGTPGARLTEATALGFQDLAALPDGRIAVAASNVDGTSGAVEVRSAGGVLDVAFAGDGSADGLVARGVSSAPGGKLVAVGGSQGTIEARRYDAGSSTSPAEGPIPLVPSRILDTRTGVGHSGPKPGAGSTITLAVAGRGGVPASGAVAVVLNVTATEADGPGFVTVWPGDQPRPNASNLNVDTPGQTIPNLVTVPLAADGTVNMFNYGGSHLLADVAAWFPAGPGFVPLTPTRILDTRAPGIGFTGPKPAAGATVDLTVVGQGGVGADATAVVLNVTATEADAAGFVTVWPTGQARPNASNVNISGEGQTIPNQVYVPVGTGGSVSLFTYGGAHLLADVAGYFTASGGFHPLTPNRILDTRASAGPIGYTGGKPIAGAVVPVTVAGAGGVPPSGATAVVMNVTATEADGPGFVTAWPSGAAQPNASNLNLDAAGQTIANLVVVPIGPDGRVNLFTFGGGHLVADVAGWIG